MPVSDESVYLTLSRYGDRWELAGARRTQGLRALQPAEDLADVEPADGPGALLEAVARRLDIREARRQGAEVAITDEDRALVADCATVLEVLERAARLDEDWLTTGTIAARAGWGQPVESSDGRGGVDRAALRVLAEEDYSRTSRALELARRDGCVTSRDSPTARYWHLTPRALEEVRR